MHNTTFTLPKSLAFYKAVSFFPFWITCGLGTTDKRDFAFSTEILFKCPISCNSATCGGIDNPALVRSAIVDCNSKIIQFHLEMLTYEMIASCLIIILLHGEKHNKLTAAHNYGKISMLYSRTLITRTPLCHLHHKSVQVSEFVQISEVHSLIYKVVINY